MKNKQLIDKQEDAKLYELFLNGNKEAFNSLIIKYRKNLIYFIMAYVKDENVAEDIAQDSFMYMIINKIEYDFKCSFKTYLYTIAKSRAINYLKKERKYSSFKCEILDIESLNDNIENNFIVKEKYLALLETIKKLKKEQQIAVYLYYFQKFKYKEICQILNQSMSKTKMTIHRARKLLHKFLKEGE